MFQIQRDSFDAVLDFGQRKAGKCNPRMLKDWNPVVKIQRSVGVFASGPEYERCETFDGKCPDVKHVLAF
jgi:hypothetical protein